MTEHPILNALIFASLGVAAFVFACAILLRIAPFKLWHEIAENRNIAAAILAGAVALAIGWIIAAAMH